MKYLFTLITAFLVLFLGKTDGRMFMSPHVEQHLSELNTNYPNEVSACLHYREIGGNLVIYDYYVPKVIKSTRMMVRSEPCEEDEARYHNHPHQNFEDPGLQKYYLEFTGDSLKNKEQLIYLSGTDIWSSVWNKNEYFFVGSKGEYAWWTYDQVKKAYNKDKQILVPIRNQKTF